MLDILTASPSVGAWKHQPMTVAEVDAHPDADRIWATIAAMQGEYQRGFDDGCARTQVEADEELEGALDSEGVKFRSRITSALKQIGARISAADADVIRRAAE